MFNGIFVLDCLPKFTEVFAGSTIEKRFAVVHTAPYLSVVFVVLYGGGQSFNVDLFYNRLHISPFGLLTSFFRSAKIFVARGLRSRVVGPVLNG